MQREGHSEEQIVYALRQIEGGSTPWPISFFFSQKDGHTGEGMLGAFNTNSQNLGRDSEHPNRDLRGFRQMPENPRRVVRK